MSRLVDSPGEPGAVVINHTHNQLTWSPSHGQPLTPAGYRDLFETLDVRIFGEAGLFADVVGGGPLDLSRVDPEPSLDADPALTLIATRHGESSVRIRSPSPAPARGAYRVNPLYAITPDGDQLRLRLQFPSRGLRIRIRRLPAVPARRSQRPRDALAQLEAGGPVVDALADLVRRRVIVDLPRRYY